MHPTKMMQILKYGERINVNIQLQTTKQCLGVLDKTKYNPRVVYTVRSFWSIKGTNEA